MQVSVIIPVFNAVKFVKEAVLSALLQPETAEVIIIDDGSLDGSIAVCLALQQEYPKVIFLQHADLQNHGAGLTRNLGIKHAKYPFIALLDADDFYLKDRFATTIKTFKEHEDADGVYECLGIYFEDEEAKRNWFSLFNYEITTLNKIVKPHELIYAMAPLGKNGWFSGDAFVGKKILFERCGLYSNLRISQDTELFLKMALLGKLYAGNIATPVAKRRVHSGNRITGNRESVYRNRLQLWKNMCFWVIENNLHKHILFLFIKQYCKTVAVYTRFVKHPSRKIQFILQSCYFVFQKKIAGYFLK